MKNPEFMSFPRIEPIVLHNLSFGYEMESNGRLLLAALIDMTSVCVSQKFD